MARQWRHALAYFFRNPSEHMVAYLSGKATICSPSRYGRCTYPSLKNIFQPRGSTEVGHRFLGDRAGQTHTRNKHRYNSWCIQLLHETCPGLVSTSLDKGVFCLLVESDCCMRLFCPGPNLCLHLGIFVGLLNNQAEFLI